MDVVDKLVLDTEFGELAADLGSDFGFFWVKITICFDWVCLEVCFLVPAFGGGAVCHAEDTIFWLQSPFYDINPHSDNACNVFQEVVCCSVQQFFWDIPAPGSSIAAVASESMRARV